MYQAREKHVVVNRLKQILALENITQSRLQNSGGFSWGLMNGVMNYNHYPMPHTRQRLVETLNQIAERIYTEEEIWPIEVTVI